MILFSLVDLNSNIPVERFEERVGIMEVDQKIMENTRVYSIFLLKMWKHLFDVNDYFSSECRSDWMRGSI